MSDPAKPEPAKYAKLSRKQQHLLSQILDRALVIVQKPSGPDLVGGIAHYGVAGWPQNDAEVIDLARETWPDMFEPLIHKGHVTTLREECYGAFPDPKAPHIVPDGDWRAMVASIEAIERRLADLERADLNRRLGAVEDHINRPDPTTAAREAFDLFRAGQNGSANG